MSGLLLTLKEVMMNRITYTLKTDVDYDERMTLRNRYYNVKNEWFSSYLLDLLFEGKVTCLKWFGFKKEVDELSRHLNRPITVEVTTKKNNKTVRELFTFKNSVTKENIDVGEELKL